MSIQVRYAPSLEEEKAKVLEAIDSAVKEGVQGIQGLQGPPGEDGEDGEDATFKPPKYINPTGAGNVTISAGQGSAFRVKLDRDVTFKFAGFADGRKFSIAVTQDGGGFDVTWPTGIKWVGGTAPTITSTDGKRDVFGFERWKNGTEDGYDGFIIGQNI